MMLVSDNLLFVSYHFLWKRDIFVFCNYLEIYLDWYSVEIKLRLLLQLVSQVYFIWVCQISRLARPHDLRLTHHWYSSLAPAHLCAFTLINKRLACLFLVLSCVVSIGTYAMYCVSSPINHSLPPPPPFSLSSLYLFTLFYHIKLFYMLFFFLLF